MTQREARKAHARLATVRADGEGGRERTALLRRDRNQIRKAGDIVEEATHAFGGFGSVKRYAKLDGLDQSLQVGFQLCPDGVIEHGGHSLVFVFFRG